MAELFPNLNRQQFDPPFGDGLYHGSHHPLQGDEILPALKIGHGVNFSGMSDPWKAYATEDEEKAWALADVSHDSQSRSLLKHQVAGRTQVHSLEPNKDMRVGLYHPDHPEFGVQSDENLAEWVSPSGFKVKETHDIRPGNQGTFNLNWNQFGRDRRAPWGDALNHPTDENIETGQWGSQRNQKHLKSWALAADTHKEIEEARQHPDQGRLL